MSGLNLLTFSTFSFLINNAAESGGWPQFCYDSRHNGYATSKLNNETEVLWTFNTSGGVRSSPAVAHDLVYVGSDDGWVYALNMYNGELNWSFETQGQVKSSPLVYGDMLFVGSYDNKLYALNAITGSHIWNFTTDDDVEGSPSFWKGTVLIGSYDSTLYALNASLS